VADRDHALEVERGRDLDEEVDAGRDVDERLRPAAARPDPPVLEIPGSEPVLREIETEPVHERAVVARPPVPAVHDDHDRERAGGLWQEQLAELVLVVPIAVQRAVDRARLHRRVALSERSGG
jgi:hypothetical protein